MSTAHHIAIILHDFSTGGSERIAIRLANRWAEMGRRVTIICGTQKGAARALVAPGVTVRPCSPETLRSPWSRIQLGWRMARIIRTEAPDIVFSPGNFHLIILAFLGRLHFVRRPIFVSKLSNPIRRTGLRHHMRSIADAAIRLAAAPADMLVAMSPSLLAEARSVFPRHAITEIAEPILEDDMAAPHSRAGLQPEPLILCAARLAPQKDLFTAIRAFAELPPSLRARLLILGEGPLRARLEREAQRLGVAARVEMPGHVPDIAPYLARADLYLMSSHYEGYPAVLVEAIAAGVPIVTTDCSLALPEIFSSPELGAIVRQRQPEAIAAAIVARLRRSPPSLIAARTIANRHRLGASAADYLALFDRIAR